VVSRLIPVRVEAQNGDLLGGITGKCLLDLSFYEYYLVLSIARVSHHAPDIVEGLYAKGAGFLVRFLHRSTAASPENCLSPGVGADIPSKRVK